MRESLPDALIVLRKLQGKFQLNLTETRELDREAGGELWRLTAASPTGERWTVACESYEEAVHRMVVMLGLALMKD